MLEAEEEKAPVPQPAHPASKPMPTEADRAEAEPGDDGDRLKAEIKSVLSYLDKLLDSLPEDKIEEFANSEYLRHLQKALRGTGLGGCR